MPGSSSSHALDSGPAPAVTAGPYTRSALANRSSGTFFSTTAPSRVVTASPSAPTARCSGSEEPTRASASRSGPLTSTLVVPHSRTSPSRACCRTSSRAYTPQQAENDSSRSRSPLHVTTGSRMAVGWGWW
jgi:hypothetical protein